MPSYKNFIILFLVLLFTSCIGNKNPQKRDNIKLFEEEDQYILYALEHEKNREFTFARDLYLSLFKKTNRYEYLKRFLVISTQLSEYEDVKKYSLEYMNKEDSSYEFILKFYIISLLKLEELDEALKSGITLLNLFNNAENYELLANIYFQRAEYKKAEEYYESAYLSSINAATLIDFFDVLYSYLNKKEKAISYLETHIRLYGCEGGVCAKLLSFYQEQKNIDGIISILKKIYFEYQNKDDASYINKVYKYLIGYLEQKNIDDAIKFLEENNIDEYKLLSLYQKKDDKVKALELLNKLYKNTGNIDLLAQIAILEFETAKDKKKILKSVIQKFEDVLIILDNHIYQNFLGYLLIDYDIDIDRGLKYIKKALSKVPNNMAYIDSLAWGLYKKKQCKEAYINMKKVVDSIGLDEEEIKMHWNKIKECK